MKTYKFVKEEHPNYGEGGWRMKSRYDFDPLQGLAIAHDIMEHLPDDDGSLWGELEAMGACAWLRGVNGCIVPPGNVFTPEEHLAAFLDEVWQRKVGMTGGDGYLRIPQYFYDRKGRPPRLRDQYIEDLIDASIEDFRSRIDDEASSMANTPELKEEYIREAHSIVSYAAVATRIGVMKAQRRYRGLNNYHLAYDVFKRIEELADQFLDRSELGDIMCVRPNFRRYKVDCWIEEPEYY